MVFRFYERGPILTIIIFISIGLIKQWTQKGVKYETLYSLLFL